MQGWYGEEGPAFSSKVLGWRLLVKLAFKSIHGDNELTKKDIEPDIAFSQGLVACYQ